MRNVNKTILEAGDSLNVTSDIIDSNQLVSGSFMAYFGDTNAAGSFTIEASNDPGPYGSTAQNFVPTNWVQIPSASATITSGASAIIPITTLCYRWIRARYSSTATGVQHVVVAADTGTVQVQTVTTVADTMGDLTNTYFLVSSVNSVTKAQKNFYVWYDNGTGTNPAIAGRTGVQVTYTSNDTASDIAIATRAALNALTNDFVATGASNQVIITNVVFGLVPAAADGAVPTGFGFTNTTPGTASNLNNKYFFLNSRHDTNQYYVWFNVDSIGTDPAPAGLTAIEVDIASGASATTVGGTMATAIAAANSSNDFTAANASGDVTVTNKTSGYFTPASDFNAGFTITITAGGTTTVTVSMNALSL